MLSVAAKVKAASILHPVTACRCELCVMTILVSFTRAQSADCFRCHTPSNTAVRCAPVSTDINRYDMPHMGTDRYSGMLCPDARLSGPVQNKCFATSCLTSVIDNIENEGQGHSQPLGRIGLLCAVVSRITQCSQDEQSDGSGQGRNCLSACTVMQEKGTTTVLSSVRP
jgi:hypothetical protein